MAPLAVAAAGNESRRDIESGYRVAALLPAAAEDMVSVTAIGHNDSKYEVAEFSNIHARLAARGVDISSCLAWWRPARPQRHQPGLPIVVGVAALWWQFMRQPDIQATAKA